MTVLGLMSGTSLDGLDLALCNFISRKKSYDHQLIQGKTVSYPKNLKEELKNAASLNAVELMDLHHRYGVYLAKSINTFLNKTGIRPDLVASHGHTVFHRPGSGFSTQIGSGAAIAAGTGLMTICDFRSLDTASGGQGAPLVPIGDKLLFGKYQSRLNIGGIANISFEKKGVMIAHDICFANMLLNFLAEREGKEFDKNGTLAAKGMVDKKLLNGLLARTKAATKKRSSLGREQFEIEILPLIAGSSLHTTQLLSTSCEYVAMMIGDILGSEKIKQVLVTGGGAFNNFLMSRIAARYKGTIVMPDNDTVKFKEAIIFAFLGYLRFHGKVNTLKSVTGAKSDSSGGAIWKP